MGTGNPDAAFGLKVGDRLRLVRMLDEHDPVEPGTLGTVKGFHVSESMPELNQVWVKWDDGRTLNLLPNDGDEWEAVTDE